MPSNVLERAGGFGARLTVGGETLWLGTHASPELAARAVERERARRSRPRRQARPAHRGSACPSVEQVEALAGAARDDVFRAFVLVGAWSGLRLFEVAALEWRDVKVHAGLATGKIDVRCGKGGRRRTSLLFGPGLEAVRQLRLEAYGQKRAPAPLVFANREGRPFTRQRVSALWGPLCDAAGVQGVTFHGLRKFHASWLLDHGVAELDAAAQLGHLKRDGRPDPEQLRRIYGFPSIAACLDRVAAIA